jgi:hypothetical protein
MQKTTIVLRVQKYFYNNSHFTRTRLYTILYTRPQKLYVC